jgi:hypothetical protein
VGGVSVLFGVGNGTFTSATFLSMGAGSFPGDVSVTDVNLDGNNDLAVACSGGNTLQVLFGSGAGLFPSRTVLPTQWGPSGVHVCPLASGRTPNLLVLCTGENSINVYDERSGSVSQHGISYGVPVGAIASAVGDFNGDGQVDVAVAQSDTLGVSVILGDPFGTVTDLPPSVLAPGLIRVAENDSLTFEVLAFDPDDDRVDNLSVDTNALPPDAASHFEVSPGNFRGVFRLHPTYSDSGSYSVQFTATNRTSSSASTLIKIFDVPTTLASAVTLKSIVVGQSVALECCTPWDADVYATVYRRFVGEDWRMVAEVYSPGSGCLRYSDQVDTPATRDYRVMVRHSDLTYMSDSVRVVLDAPSVLLLAEPSPNPSSGMMTVRYGVPISGFVRLQVFDVRGRLVRTLRRQKTGPGWSAVAWDGRDTNSQQISAGVYFMRLECGSLAVSRRLVLVR